MRFGSPLHQAPNTILSHKRMTMALVALHKDRACLFSQVSPELAAAACSGTIRQVMAKFRAVYEEAGKRLVVKTKAPGNLARESFSMFKTRLYVRSVGSEEENGMQSMPLNLAWLGLRG